MPFDRAKAQNAADYLGSECTHRADDHFVQFYETDQYLIESVGSFIASGLATGETALVLATVSHLKELTNTLEDQGFELELLTRLGKFACLDVETVQADLTVDGNLCEERFTSFVSALLEQAGAGQRPVRVFGELVALYWAQGKYATAIEIERLWNGLAKKYKFSLFCAYPCSLLGGTELTEPLRQVCETHSRIVPAESYSSLTEPLEQLHEIALLQQKALTLTQEITAHRATAQQLSEAQVAFQAELAKSQAANQLKDEFLATVSHELRTPLNAIIGWSHLLNEGRLDASTVASALKSIERNAKSQAQLIEALLDLSRMISGQIQLNLAVVDLRQLIHEVVNSNRAVAEAKSIKLTLILDPEVGQMVGDRNRLQQIISSLLSNAIKFTPELGHVFIEIKRLKDEVAIEVTDDGEGIEPEFLESIFDKFRQADASTTRRHSGLGLGLSIVKHLVEMHAGYITVGSPGINLGASFVVHLPVTGPHTEFRTLTDDGRVGIANPFTMLTDHT